MRRLVACAMATVLMMITTTPGPAVAGTVPLPLEATPRCCADTGEPPDSTAKWKEDAQRIPVGKKIKIKTTSGETLKGVLRTVGDTSVTIELKTENQVRAVEVRYSEIQRLERQGRGRGAKVAIIVGVTLGVWLIVGLLGYGCAGC